MNITMHSLLHAVTGNEDSPSSSSLLKGESSKDTVSLSSVEDTANPVAIKISSVLSVPCGIKALDIPSFIIMCGKTRLVFCLHCSEMCS